MSELLEVWIVGVTYISHNYKLLNKNETVNAGETDSEETDASKSDEAGTDAIMLSEKEDEQMFWLKISHTFSSVTCVASSQ